MEEIECGACMRGACGKGGKGCQETSWYENLDQDTVGQYNHTSRRQAWIELKKVAEDFGESTSASSEWRGRWRCLREGETDISGWCTI